MAAIDKNTNKRSISPSKGDGFTAVFAACFALFAGSIVFNLFPVFLGAAAEKFSLSASQVGLLGSLALTGFGAASASAPFWIKGIKRSRFCQRALFACAICLGLSTFAGGFRLLALWLFLSGLFGGATFACALDALGATQKKERNFGLSILVIQLSSAILLIGISSISGARGFQPMTLVMATFVLLGALFSGFIFDRQIDDVSTVDKKITTAAAFRSSFFLPVVSLIALALFGIGVVGVWAFLERFASAGGVSSDDIVWILAQGYLAGAGGALLASFLADRAGRILPIFFASAVLIIALMFAPASVHAGLFLFVALGFQGAWNFIIPYQFTIISDVDSTERMLVAAPAFQAVGAVAGPSIAGIIATGGNFTPVLVLGAVTVAVSSLFFVAADHHQRKLPR